MIKLLLLLLLLLLIVIILKLNNNESFSNNDIIINVINLEKSKERLEYFKLMCKKLNIKYNKISGIDGSKYNLNKYERDLYSNVDYNINKKKGVIGCHLSHIKALNSLKDNDYSIICEDDIDILEPEFNKIISELLQKINVNDNYLIYLSGTPHKQPIQQVMNINNKYDLYKGNKWTGQGNRMYLITRKCMKDLLNKNNKENVKRAVDWHFIDNAENTLIIYPPLVDHRKNHASTINLNNIK